MDIATRQKTFERTCREALREGGSRLTQARLSIIAAVAKSHTPLTAKEIMQTLQLEDGTASIDMVSIYRTLARLAELGLVHETSPGSYLPCRHLRCAHEAHVLVKCLSCGRLEESELPEAVLSPLVWFLRENRRFEPDHHVLKIEGHCQACVPERSV